MSERTVDQLKAEFVQAAITYGEDLGSGRKSTKIGDRAFAAAEKAFNKLKAQGEQDRILDLLEFAHPAVRLLAAGFAVRFGVDVERGLAVTESIAKGTGPIAAMADSSLHLYRWKQQQSGATTSA